MIKHFAYQQQQKPKFGSQAGSHHIQPTENGENLFNPPHRAQVVGKIKKLVKTPPEHFEALYLILLYNSGEFVQHLPLFNEPNEIWLDVALARAYQSLQALE